MADNLKPIDPIKLCINITIPSIDDDSVSLYEAVGILSKKMQEAIDQINASLGALEGAYSVQNPPPYPVTSVNGKTGAVTVDIPELPDNVYSSDNPPPYPVKSVNNAETANIQTLFVPEGTTSGTLDDVSQEELIAACKAGATLAAVDSDGNTFKLYHLELLSMPERVEYYELAQGESAVTSVNGKDGQVVLTGGDLAVSSADETKISTKIANVEGDIAEVSAKADEAYGPNNAPPYPVTTVNGKTGNINIPQSFEYWDECTIGGSTTKKFPTKYNLYILCTLSPGGHTVTSYFPQALATGAWFRLGSYRDNNFNSAISVSFANSLAQLKEAYINGSPITSGATLKVYVQTIEL